MSGLSHLDELEAEAIYIIREVAAECEKPVMLYSIGKDSSVMLHLAMKAFYPEKPPFPFLHIDTTWKFREMIEFRDRIAKENGIEMLVYTNQEGVDAVSRLFDVCLAVCVCLDQISRTDFDAASAFYAFTCIDRYAHRVPPF